MSQCARHGGDCTPDAACCTDWQEVNAKLQAALLQIRELQEDKEALIQQRDRAHAAADSQEKDLEDANRLNGEVERLLHLWNRREIDPDTFAAKVYVLFNTEKPKDETCSVCVGWKLGSSVYCEEHMVKRNHAMPPVPSVQRDLGPSPSLEAAPVPLCRCTHPKAKHNGSGCLASSTGGDCQCFRAYGQD